jgi:hypothetical protein
MSDNELIIGQASESPKDQAGGGTTDLPLARSGEERIIRGRPSFLTVKSVMYPSEINHLGI